MNRFICTFSVIASMVFVGCFSTRKIGVYTPQKSLIRSYSIGADTSVSIGDPIFEVENGRTYPTYEVAFDYQPPGIGAGGITSMDSLKKGMEFNVVGQLADDGSLIVQNKQYHSYMGIIINSEGYPTSGWIGLESNLLGIIYSANTFTREKLFNRSAKNTPVRGSFRAQMIYSGLSGATVKAVYREYTDDAIRPAFTTDLQYNLDESKIIAYRSIKIEVVKATNSAINFKVISDDGLPWLP